MHRSYSEPLWNHREQLSDSYTKECCTVIKDVYDGPVLLYRQRLTPQSVLKHATWIFVLQFFYNISSVVSKYCITRQLHLRWWQHIC